MFRFLVLTAVCFSFFALAEDGGIIDAGSTVVIGQSGGASHRSTYRANEFPFTPRLLQSTRDTKKIEHFLSSLFSNYENGLQLEDPRCHERALKDRLAAYWLAGYEKQSLSLYNSRRRYSSPQWRKDYDYAHHDVVVRMAGPEGEVALVSSCKSSYYQAASNDGVAEKVIGTPLNQTAETLARALFNAGNYENLEMPHCHERELFSRLSSLRRHGDRVSGVASREVESEMKGWWSAPHYRTFHEIQVSVRGPQGFATTLDSICSTKAWRKK